VYEDCYSFKPYRLLFLKKEQVNRKEEAHAPLGKNEAAGCPSPCSGIMSWR
jgi:hypothetical protein